jgi:membrane protein YdbS with pleckstrin-like domain
MEQSQPLRLEAKRVNRVAGWLLAVPVGFLWLLAVVFALLSLAALLQNGAVGLAAGLVTGLVVLLAALLRK